MKIKNFYNLLKNLSNNSFKNLSNNLYKSLINISKKFPAVIGHKKNFFVNLTVHTSLLNLYNLKKLSFPKFLRNYPTEPDVKSAKSFDFLPISARCRYTK